MKLSFNDARKLGIKVETRKTRQAKIEKAAEKRRKTATGETARKTLFLSMCQAHGLPVPVDEFPFGEPVGRDWRFDWLFDGWLALEIQGGLFVQGRHVRGAALLLEYEKLNWAARLGYSVLFFTPAEIESGSAFPFINACLTAKEDQS